MAITDPITRLIISREPSDIELVDPELVVCADPELVVCADPELVVCADPELVVCADPELVICADPDREEIEISGTELLGGGSVMLLLALSVVRPAVGREGVGSILHIGVTPDHLPLESQVRVTLPTSMKPSSQVYTTSEPNAVPVRLMLPLSGAETLPQSTAVKEELINQPHHRW